MGIKKNGQLATFCRACHRHRVQHLLTGCNHCSCSYRNSVLGFALIHDFQHAPDRKQTFQGGALLRDVIRQLTLQCEDLVQQVTVDPIGSSALLQPVERERIADIAALEYLRRKGLRCLLHRLIATGNTASQVQPLGIDAAALPGPGVAFILPCGTGESGHALQGHRALGFLMARGRTIFRSIVFMTGLIACPPDPNKMTLPPEP